MKKQIFSTLIALAATVTVAANANVVDSILVHIHSAAYHDRHDLRAGIAVDNTWSEIKLNTPYKLETGKPVYIGYTVVRPTNEDCPVTYDRTPVESDCSFWMNYSLDGERRQDRGTIFHFSGIACGH